MNCSNSRVNVTKSVKKINRYIYEHMSVKRLSKIFVCGGRLQAEIHAKALRGYFF